MKKIKLYPLLLLVIVLMVINCNYLIASALPKIVVISTGGTIAMKLDEKTKEAVPALTGKDLIEAVPQIKDLADIEVVEFSNIDSSYMTPDHWIKLAKLVNKTLQRDDVTGVVITHGTDTMEETSYFLDLTVDSRKPVVLTGAQRTATDKDSDGPRNILNATRIILSKAPFDRGVMICMNNYINAARPVRKTNTNNVQTFESGEYGYLGYVDDDRVIYYNKPLRRFKLPLPNKLAKVDVLTMFTGSDGKYIRYAADNGIDGLVVVAFGRGNVNKEVYEAMEYAIKKGVYVVIATRVYYGSVKPVYGVLGGGGSLEKLGAIFADDLTPAKARILLMLALGQTNNREEIQNLYYK